MVFFGEATEQLRSHIFQSRSGASVRIAVRDAAAAAGQPMAAGEGKSLACRNAARGHGSSPVRSLCLCQAGAHSVPDGHRLEVILAAMRHWSESTQELHYSRRLVEAHRWSCVQPTYAGAG